MNKSPNIAIVGLGNLGWNLASRLSTCGYSILQILSRPHPKDDTLLKDLGAERIASVEELRSDIDLIFLCTSDDALETVAKEVKHPATLVHCSGSTPLLREENCGVFYAFQTFTKYVDVAWEGIPIFIESPSESVREGLLTIAEKLSGNARVITGDQRKHVHISGVFGANFVNHILHQAKHVLDKSDLPFDILEPLMHETMRKAFELGPKDSQTGPARRGDEKLIKNHLDYLASDDELHDIYALLTKHIQSTYQP